MSRWTDLQTAAGVDQSPVVATPSVDPRRSGSQRPARSASGLGVPLRPTKTRLALLQAVADGRVYAGHGAAGSWWDAPPGSHTPRYVDARCLEAHRAGWIALDPVAWGGGSSRRYWHLTDFGRAVLDGAR